MTDVFTGRVYSGSGAGRCDDLLADYPVALLVPSCLTAPTARRSSLTCHGPRFDRLGAGRATGSRLRRRRRHYPRCAAAAPTAGGGSTCRGAGRGRRDYAFLLDDDDAAARPPVPWQPAGVHGPSRASTTTPAFAWTDAAWTGRQLPGSVLYELHVGTFTPEGTFDAAIEQLDHLVELGVDLVELLPVNAFNGNHNWGYDGVCWYAAARGVRRPRRAKRFVDAAHARGLGVILDVVYNHFGPSGAYAPMFGPYLDAGRATPGAARSTWTARGSDEVRRYIMDNALMWLRDYHVDGLRLDAVHACTTSGRSTCWRSWRVEVEVARRRTSAGRCR